MTTLTAPFKYGDQTYQIEYELEALNDAPVLELLAQARKTTDANEAARLGRLSILHVVTQWDLPDYEGEPLPLTEEALHRRAPATYPGLIQKAISAHARQYKQGALGVRRGPKYTPPKPTRKRKGKGKR